MKTYYNEFDANAAQEALNRVGLLDRNKFVFGSQEADDRWFGAETLTKGE